MLGVPLCCVPRSNWPWDMGITWEGLGVICSAAWAKATSSWACANLCSCSVAVDHFHRIKARSGTVPPILIMAYQMVAGVFTELESTQVLVRNKTIWLCGPTALPWLGTLLQRLLHCWMTGHKYAYSRHHTRLWAMLTD